jgi:hypothetical protein
VSHLVPRRPGVSRPVWTICGLVVAQIVLVRFERRRGPGPEADQDLTSSVRWDHDVKHQAGLDTPACGAPIPPRGPVEQLGRPVASLVQ